jgi:Na+/H+ antiporter NhaD/arsenite permease-like protein
MRPEYLVPLPVALPMVIAALLAALRKIMPRRLADGLAMAATLAGNFTILGSVANLIVVQRAKRHGIEIGFWTYFKLGAPLTVITIAIGVLLLR